VRCLVIGNRQADDMFQDETGNVEPEPESVGHHSGVEDARGIDRLESRYASARPFPGSCTPLLAPLASMGGRQSRGASAELCFTPVG
jgi:hypothetical protein